MSYGPGRSRLVQGTLVGAAVWLVGFLVCAVGVTLLLDIFTDAGPGELAVVYGGVTVWFVFLAAWGPNILSVWIYQVLVALGLFSSLLSVAGGAVAVTRVDDIEHVWDAIKVGSTVGVGHVVLMVVAFSLAGPETVGDIPARTRTFTLAFGGFVFPAVFGVAGAVAQHLYDRR